jgi:hypothetical protein
VLRDLQKAALSVSLDARPLHPETMVNQERINAFFARHVAASPPKPPKKGARVQEDAGTTETIPNSDLLGKEVAYTGKGRVRI